jgi:RNA recognition motif-containing protein
MKVSKGKSKMAGVKGSNISLKNYEREQNAGRKGSKRFVDPNKVFVGNLDYSVTSDMVHKWLIEDQGVPKQHLVKCKVITYWKTNKSKGYGFVQFTSPIYATSAMELIRNKKLQGRVVRLDQGQKKPSPQLGVLLKKKKVDEDAPPLSPEEAVIFGAITDADSTTISTSSESESLVTFEDMLEATDGDYVYDDTDADADDAADREMDAKEQAILNLTKEMMENNMEVAVDYSTKEEMDMDGLDMDGEVEYEFWDEEVEMNEEFDDSDEGVDGFYKEEFMDDEEKDDDGKVLNRSQRREVAKSVKKRRKTANGFKGGIPEPKKKKKQSSSKPKKPKSSPNK